MAFQIARSKSSSPRTIGLVTLISALALYTVFLLIPSHTSTRELFVIDSSVPTNVTHIAFAILGSRKSRSRRPFVELWWQPNDTRGLIWLEPSQEEVPWPTTSPPYRIFDEGVPVPLQMKKVMEETLAVVHGSSPRWLVIGDDDTVFFVENLVEVLQRYDHNEFYYIGGESESAIQNSRYYGMAFGGGGVAFSSRLVKAILPLLDNCLRRYQSFYILDHIMYSCITEIGVPLTREQGFHQVDLRGNISGFLSAHPQAPLVSLHHVELIDPIFPSVPSRVGSMEQLMRAGRVDSSRLLQQSFCYERGLNWTFAVSFGYSVHVHEWAVEPKVLQVPLQSFKAWRRSIPQFTFEARQWWRDPCLAPHLFYLHGVGFKGDGVVSKYRRYSPRDLPLCGNHSANALSRITVITPKQRRRWVGSRRECCEVIKASEGADQAALRVKPCMEGQNIY